MDEMTKGKMEPEREELKSLSAGTGLEVPGQQRLSSWGMQRTTVVDCLLVDGSSDLGETSSPKDFVVGEEPDNKTSPLFASSRKLVFLQMSSKAEHTKELANEATRSLNLVDEGGNHRFEKRLYWYSFAGAVVLDAPLVCFARLSVVVFVFYASEKCRL